MSQRRMFSPQIVDSDAFLDMSPSSQNLYFHMVMRADDDGFVGNPKKILRMVGGNDDDLKILIAKRFVLTFESGVVVIKHWRIHNLIRADRYNQTKYLDEKNTLIIKDNGSYTEMETIRQPDDNQVPHQVRLGKVKLSKDEEREVGDESPTPAQEAKDFFSGNFEVILQEFIEKTHGPPEQLRNEVSKFVLYWTEKNKSGTKQRWEQQKTFEVKRRLATWLGNVKQFQRVEFSKGRGLA